MIRCGVHDWFETVLGVGEAEWLRLFSKAPETMVRVTDYELGLRRLCKVDFVKVPAAGAGSAAGAAEYAAGAVEYAAGAGSAAAEDAAADVLPGGCFSVWSVRELKEAGEAVRGACVRGGDDGPPITVFVRTSESRSAEGVDVHQLQSKAKPGTMFQVASNFNCLEAANETVDVASGMFVTKLMTDHTQGPAASSACALAAVVRTHVAFAPEYVGQCARGRQIELLGDAGVAPYFPVLNGKLYASSSGLSVKTQQRLPQGLSADVVRVGLHCDAVPMFRRISNHEVEVSTSTSTWIPVDQVFVSSLDLRARGLRPLTKDVVMERMHFLLEGAYQGTYAACRLRGSKVLVLTLVGGGVFGNPWAAIGQAIGRAHATWVRLCPLLKSVQLPIFTVPSKADLQSLIRSIEAQGVRIKLMEL